jgi:hypothetical protein
MIEEDILCDMNAVKEILSKKDSSIVVIKKGIVLAEKKGEGITPILQTIEELKQNMEDSVVGDRALGKATSLLCINSKVKAVYSPQGTKTAIAILIVSGVTTQVDALVPYIKNKKSENVCPYEEMLKGINDPQEAYGLLKKKVNG